MHLKCKPLLIKHHDNDLMCVVVHMTVSLATLFFFAS